MSLRAMISGAALAIAIANVSAQKPPAVRQLGRLERVSAESLASAATALPMPGGRVLVNDINARRLLLFDSTLAHATVVADTTSATANAYGGRGSTLIRYRGDTAMFIDPASLSMFVVGPTGTIVRVMAVPRPDEAQALIGGVFGTPGFDARGRLVYFGGSEALPGVLMLPVGEPLSTDPRFLAHVTPNLHIDSSVLVRADLTTRVLDTIAVLRTPKRIRTVRTDAQGLVVSIETMVDPLPLVDQWAVMPDGSIAVVRARDYHVDWITADGKTVASSKMPYDWQHVSDERKQTLIDSAVKFWQAQYDKVADARRAQANGRGGGGGGAGGRGGGGSGTGARPAEIAPNIAARPRLDDVPDYLPPFTENAVQADADGNVWIRTTTMVKGQPVYDIVNRRGELFDRVQLPSFRTIAGFGPGVVYMAMKDGAGVVHLERARVK